jgi:hypothetical protein
MCRSPSRKTDYRTVFQFLTRHLPWKNPPRDQARDHGTENGTAFAPYLS